MEIEFVQGLTAFVLGVVGHMIFLRIVGARRYVLNSLLFMIAIAAFLLFSSGLIAAVAFVTFWNFYFFVLANATNSFSLRILAEIEKAPDGEMSFTEMSEKFPMAGSFQARMASMKASGLVAGSDETGWTVVGPGRWIGGVLSLTHRIFSLRAFG